MNQIKMVRNIAPYMVLGVSVDLVSSRAVNSRAMKYIEPEVIARPEGSWQSFA